jgi:RimJ/RimL family protein N-acetyltransferase
VQHLEGLAALGRDVDVQRFTYVPSPWVDGFERAWLERYEQGHEDGTRAAFAIVDEADGTFEVGLGELGLERVELRMTTDNVVSMRVAERCGFVREGILRSVHPSRTSAATSPSTRGSRATYCLGQARYASSRKTSRSCVTFVSRRSPSGRS